MYVMCRKRLANQHWLAVDANDAMDANDGWQSQVTSISIYSPLSSRREYRLFLPKKALLHSDSDIRRVI